MGISILTLINWNILDKSIPFSIPLPLSVSKRDLYCFELLWVWSAWQSWVIMVGFDHLKGLFQAILWRKSADNVIMKNESCPTNKSSKISVKIRVSVFLAHSLFLPLSTDYIHRSKKKPPSEYISEAI